MATPGVLYVTMQPSPGLPLAQFDEWYNNEHGPTRLRLPQIFANGQRYRASDGQEPAYLAVYDVPRMQELLTTTYTDLRAQRSPREAQTIGQVQVTRYFYDLVDDSRAEGYRPLETLTDEETRDVVVLAVRLELNDMEGAEREVSKWYLEEHIGALSKIPGWRRSRWFRTSGVEPGARPSTLTIHEFARENGLGGPEHVAAGKSPWRDEVMGKYVVGSSRRIYDVFYVFGPAPRESAALTQLPDAAAFTSADGKTSTVPGKDWSITSYVTTADGLELPYRLEGNAAADAPLVAFCNSLLTSLRMWDPFVEMLKRERPDLKILRYDQRGRHGVPAPPKPATPDLLAADLLCLLDALRVSKLHALVGVSMGGVTSLAFALAHPTRLGRLVACDFNVTSSAANTQAWKDRVAIAEKDGGKGMRDELAGQTVARWFHPATMEGKPDTVKWMTGIVAGNDVEGFRWSCQALWDYDLKPKMRASTVPALFVVGDGDAKGALVKAMQGFKGEMGEKGVELRLVKDTGHLPMAEDPAAFWAAVEEFL